MNIFILAIIAVLTGCSQQPQERQYTEITTTPTEQPASSPMDMENPHGNMPMDMMQLPEGSVLAEGSFTWVAPKGWVEEAGNNLRLATFRLAKDKEAIDCSIVNLAGPAGGLEANLRRWMGQISISPTDAQIAQLISGAVKVTTSAKLEGKLYDFSQIQVDAKATDKSMLVVMIRVSNSTLFVKLSGTIESIKINKVAFLDLVKTIKEKDGSVSVSKSDKNDPHVGINMNDPHAGLNMNDPHAGMDMNDPHVGMDINADIPDMPQQELLKWTLPEGWIQAKARSMRLATFHQANNETAIDCSIISLAGEAGGLDGNLSRWMGQIGIDANPDNIALVKKNVQEVKIAGNLSAAVYDLTILNTSTAVNAKSMIVGIVSINNMSIFIKMTGQVKDLANNKSAFLNLIQSLSQP